MIKSTTHRNSLPVVITLAIAMVASAPLTQAAVDTRITTVAQQAANDATIENVANVAVTFSGLIGDGSIKLSNANVKALANVLSSAIGAKIPNDLENRLTNKGDETAENAALIAAGITVNAGFKKAANNAALNLLKGALQSVKKNAGLIANSAPNIFSDVAGSVMQSFVSAPASVEKTDKKIYSFLIKNAAKVAGAKNSKAIKTGLKEAFKNPALAVIKYEDGTFGVIIDPETDTRNA